MAQAIREVYGSVLAELGEKNKDIVVLDADLSGSTKSKIFGQKFPERFFNMGIAESNMVSTAAGLSTTGKIPFVNTFTVFLTTLGLIATRAQVCYGNLNVKLGGDTLVPVPSNWAPSRVTLTCTPVVRPTVVPVSELDVDMTLDEVARWVFSALVSELLRDVVGRTDGGGDRQLVLRTRVRVLLRGLGAA